MVSRRDFMNTVGMGIAWMAVANAAWGATGKRPNIVFIMSDDHAAKAIGRYGSRLAGLDPTPVIDSLAEEGMLFENVFCNNSICVPSRASILTGQYSQTNGVLTNEDRLPKQQQYLPREMKKLGYQTAIIGKWHLKNRPEAFDYYEVLRGQGSYFNPKFRRNGQGGTRREGHSSDAITDGAIEWLENREKDRPFLLMYHFKAAHGGWNNAPRYDSYLQDVEIPEPESLYKSGNHGSVATRGKNDSLTHAIGHSISKRHTRRSMGQHVFNVDPSLPDREYTHRTYQLYLKRYLRCVKGIDDNIGRFLEYMKSEGLLDNTVIVYTSDQGMFLGEHDYNDKRWMYEEGMRMPFIMRYPGVVEPGSKCDLLINNTDFAPTLIEIAEGDPPDYMQGRSFLEALKGGTPADWREATYYRYWRNMVIVPAHFGIRTKRYKLIFFYGRKAKGVPGRKMETPPGWEFYDLKKDPREMNNVYGKPEYEQVIARLKKVLKRKREELNETDDQYPGVQKVIEEHWDD